MTNLQSRTFPTAHNLDRRHWLTTILQLHMLSGQKHSVKPDRKGQAKPVPQTTTIPVSSSEFGSSLIHTERFTRRRGASTEKDNQSPMCKQEYKWFPKNWLKDSTSSSPNVEVSIKKQLWFGRVQTTILETERRASGCRDTSFRPSPPSKACQSVENQDTCGAEAGN